ncbi:MAG: ribosome silencing factor [Planctomycetes bacterium]|nr:ribosome silencing factor [Planctomycetota bacterium]
MTKVVLGGRPRRRRETGDRTIDTLEAARIAYAACAEKRATDIRILEVRGLTIVADYFVICTASSSVNAKAIADEVRDQLKLRGKRTPIGVEGRESGWWVLVDFGDLIVHVFQADAREYYGIDETWADARVVEQSEAA